MYSILREAFIYKPEALLSKKLSIVGKLILYLQLIILGIIPSYLSVYIGFSILVLLFLVTGMIKGFMKLLRLLAILVLIAFLFQILSFIVYGYKLYPYRLFEAFTNNLRLVVLAGSTSLFLSITSTRELRWLFNNLGLREIGNTMQLTIIVLAYMLFLADNASFIFSLKRSSREVVRKFLKPMLFSSVVAARQVAEYTAFYGIPGAPRSIKKKLTYIDIIVNATMFLTIITTIVITLIPLEQFIG